MKINILILLFVLKSVHSLRILGIFPHVGRTHFIVFQPLMRALAERGHQVSVISHYPLDIPIDNYKDISLRGSVQLWESIVPIHELVSSSLIALFFSELALGRLSRTTCEAMIKNEEVKRIERGQYDLIIVEQFNSDCSLGIVHKLKVPFIGITSHIARSYSYDRIGFVQNPSFVSSYHHGADKGVLDVAEILLYNTISKWMHYFNSQLPEHRMLKEYYGEDLPQLETIARNMSMMMVNTYFPFGGSVPMAANILEIGGIHLHYKTNDGLPVDLEKFLNNSKDGVVLFSMGTLIKSATWPKDKLKAFTEAFALFPQDFLWKWDADEMEGIPKNVKIAKWIPQYEVLHHRNIRAFITHGGMLSMTEAIHAGVPVITMPAFGDQFNNGLNARDKGMGVVLGIDNITKESVVWALNAVLDNRIQVQAKSLSAKWRDRPLSPMDSAIYWIEHIHRHGGSHLRSISADVPMIRYLLLDVIGLVLLMIAVFIWILRRCWRKKTKID